MSKGKYISVGQIPKLQTLYSQFAATQFDPAGGDERSKRLAWAERELGLEHGSLESFKALKKSEASQLIDVLLVATGQKVTPPDRSKKSKRDQAQRKGTAGRRGDISKEVVMASADDLAAIDELLHDLGWDRARLDNFLRSPSSPLGRRSNPEIRTDKDANKVRWALKRIRARQQKQVSA